MLPPLTDNQIILLRHVASAQMQPTTEALAQLPNSAGDPFGENAARNAMNRLEQRSLVVGSGKGKKKTWAFTRLGQQELEDLPAVASTEPPAAAAPAAPNGTSDESPKSSTRPYTILEQVDLFELIGDQMDAELVDQLSEGPAAFLKRIEQALGGTTVYLPLDTITATNADNALRAAGKAIYAEHGLPADPPNCAAVARFRVEELEISPDARVKVGGRA